MNHHFVYERSGGTHERSCVATREYRLPLHTGGGLGPLRAAALRGAGNNPGTLRFGTLRSGESRTASSNPGTLGFGESRTGPRAARDPHVVAKLDLAKLDPGRLATQLAASVRPRRAGNPGTRATQVEPLLDLRSGTLKPRAILECCGMSVSRDAKASGTRSLPGSSGDTGSFDLQTASTCRPHCAVLRDLGSFAAGSSVPETPRKLDVKKY